MSRNKSFLSGEKPLLVSMLQADTPDGIKTLADLSIAGGADALGMQFCRLKPEYKNEKTYREILSYAEEKPVYVTNYRYDTNEGISDDLLGEGLLSLASYGATLCDVMGDLYDKCEGELTMNEAAVGKQMRLIDDLHKRGAEVLMSSHVLKFTPAERVLEIALEQKRRGADICKIVTGAETVAEEIENLRIIDLLKRELSIPFLFLSGGEARLLRRVGATLGNCMTLCVCRHDAFSTPLQPLLSDMRILNDVL